MATRNDPQPGQTWKHYKGGLYEIVDRATCAENNWAVVIYRSKEDGKLYTRPLYRFMSPTTTNENRFEQV